MNARVNFVSFPICGKRAPAHCRSGSTLAKAAWTIPTQKAREVELSCFRPQNGHFILLAPSDGAGPAECHVENPGTSHETASVQGFRPVPIRELDHLRKLRFIRAWLGSPDFGHQLIRYFLVERSNPNSGNGVPGGHGLALYAALYERERTGQAQWEFCFCYGGTPVWWCRHLVAWLGLAEKPGMVICRRRT